MLSTGVQPSHLHPPAERAWVIFSNNHPKIDFFSIFWTAPTLGALLGEFIFSWWCLLCPRSVLILNSNCSPFSVLHSDIVRAFLCKSKRWHPITCSCIDCCHCRLSGTWGEKHELWWNCSSMARQAGLCVYVFSSRSHSEDQTAHYICSVKTFWLVLTIPRGWDSVWRLRLELGLDCAQGLVCSYAGYGYIKGLRIHHLNESPHKVMRINICVCVCVCVWI